MMRAVGRLPAVLVATVLVVTACGGDDAAPPADPETTGLTGVLVDVHREPG